MMKRITLLVSIICFFSSLSLAQTTVKSADGKQVTIIDTSRIITIGGSITETVFALGAGSRVISVDISSSYPEQINSLPKVPYLRQLSAGGILSLKPTLIFAGEDASPKTAIYQLRKAGVPVVLVPTEASIEGVVAKIKLLAKALGRQKRGKQLIARLHQKLRKARVLQRKATGKPPKVMFILSLGHGSPIIAGKHSSATGIINLAGGNNVFQSFSGYKAVNTAAIAAANPDIILVMGNQLDVKDRIKRIKQIPGISLTKAAKNNRIYFFDGNYIIGFGPRAGDAVIDLMHTFYPGLNK